MYELKKLSAEAIPRSLEKAERYRLLNEPAEAESICLDILHIDPENQQALITLLLALTDEFEGDVSAGAEQAEAVRRRLRGAYEQAYYAGIICERRGKARLKRGGPGADLAAYDWLRKAMDWFEQAERLSPAGNNDPALRWNTCARLMMRKPPPQPGPEDRIEHQLE
jgi:hypothetical protein